MIEVKDRVCNFLWVLVIDSYLSYIQCIFSDSSIGGELANYEGEILYLRYRIVGKCGREKVW